MQITDEDAPVVERYVPVMHLEQTEVPVVALYCPAAHPMQLVDDHAAVSAKKSPTAQLVHADDPVTVV